MRRTGALACLTLSAALALAACSTGSDGATSSSGSDNGGITVTDDVGRTVHLDHPVTRAVVVSRYNNELVRAMGSIDKVVGVDLNTSQDRAYWPQFDPKDAVGKGQQQLNYEQIIKLKPDVVITPKNSGYEKAAAKLEPAGIKVVVVTGWDNAHLPRQMEILGKTFGNETGASKVSDFFTTTMKSVQQRVGSVTPKKTVYWEYGDDYTTAIPKTSNDGWNAMIVAAGGVNIFADAPVSTKTVDPEKILQANPDLIIKTTSGKALKNTGVYAPPTTAEFQQIAAEMVKRPGWADLKAVNAKNLYVTTGFAGGGLGKMVGTVYTAKWLYPEQMKDVDPDKVFAEWMRMQGKDTPPSHVYRLP